jgi:LacI family transcriptional regulator
MGMRGESEWPREPMDNSRAVPGGFVPSKSGLAVPRKGADKRMVYTMRDVAAQAGVSPSTVSRVLSNTHYISAKTEKRVLEVVRELSYYKNVHARRLATGKSDLFGMVISEIANPFFAEVIKGFQGTAWDLGFDVLLMNTEYAAARTESVIRKLIESDVRGVAIMTSSIDREMAKPLTEAGIGVVFSNLGRAEKLVGNVSIDYKRGILEAIEHVAALGHRLAAVIGGPETNRTAAHIREALVTGLKQRGMESCLTTSSNYRVDAGASAVREILSSAETPTVIFCGSDLIALGAITALEEAGVRIPEDVSIVGIDDISFACLARPPLTTIQVPRESLGATAFHALQKMLNLKRQRGTEYSLETKLVIRKSTAPVRKRALKLAR